MTDHTGCSTPTVDSKRHKLCELGTGEQVHMMSYKAHPDFMDDFEQLIAEMAASLYNMTTGITDVRVCHPRCGEVCFIITFLSVDDMILFKDGPAKQADARLKDVIIAPPTVVSGCLMPKTYTLTTLLDFLKQNVVGTSHREHDFRNITKELAKWFPRKKEYMRYVHWDQVNPQQYTRNLIYGNSNMDVILMCWPAGSRSTIHDHDLSSCWVMMVEGTVHEVQYAVPTLDKTFIASQMKNPTGAVGRAGKLRIVTETKLTAGGITSTYVNNDISIHRVENRTDEPAYTLHVYAPPLSKMKIFTETGEVTVKCSKASEPYTSVGGELVQVNLDVEDWNSTRYNKKRTLEDCQTKH